MLAVALLQSGRIYKS